MLIFELEFKILKIFDQIVTIDLPCCRIWEPPESNNQFISRHRHDQELQVVSEDSATIKAFFF